jgi:hypothetical protein
MRAGDVEGSLSLRLMRPASKSLSYFPNRPESMKNYQIKREHFLVKHRILCTLLRELLCSQRVQLMQC